MWGLGCSVEPKPRVRHTRQQRNCGITLQFCRMEPHSAHRQTDSVAWTPLPPTKGASCQSITSYFGL